ncbi:PH domain-containing protein [Arcticibacter sp.]|jgi:hypothetical protein|uniref:PH domain-containing protein n=1 Tax=Arcticibacter sp. TaxID=1872630 RepID=UPI00388F8A53
MNFEKFLIDEQDPKAVEKILVKLSDMLTPGEEILYLAVQKKPAVTLVPDTVAVTSRRLFFCIPGNLGLTTNFEIYSWKDIKEVSFKEEFFGARFTAVPLSGENFTVDYIPKVQARKLYQFSNQQIDKLKAELKQEQYLKEQEQRREQLEKEARAQAEAAQQVISEAVTIVPEPVEPFEDEITMKLKKLKVLFEKQLISQEEYEAKKSDILSQF